MGSTRHSRRGSKMAATRSAECPNTPRWSLTRLVRPLRPLPLPSVSGLYGATRVASSNHG
eukprot:12924946-Prorocentrum_lima.AAC.1